MEVIILPSAEEAAELAADAVQALLAQRPQTVLGLATGSSPLALYGALIRRHRAGILSFSEARAFLLDEYLGLAPDHPQRYEAVIAREFVSHLDFYPGAVRGPSGDSAEASEAGRAYEAVIRDAGGIDLQVLGIGADGHLAFNEPGSSLASRTRVKTLTEQTRRDNARFFGGDVASVPRHVMTQGLGSILEARHLVLLAAGPVKAEAVHRMVEGPVSALWPATVLQHHPHVTVLLDEAAASRLQLAAYYRETFAHKPSWQSL
jgi:glucosamine-6-phosphate deaminase